MLTELNPKLSNFASSANTDSHHKYEQCVAIVFPFSVDDKESNSSGDGNGKAKSSTATASTSNNSNSSTTKNVNSNFNDSTTTDKAISTNKASMPSSSSNSDLTVTSSGKSVESELAKGNNCDALSEAISNAIDTIKVEIKDDPDAPKAPKSVNNLQPALGGSLLPPHAANAKHPVSIKFIFAVYVMHC